MRHDPFWERKQQDTSTRKPYSGQNYIKNAVSVAWDNAREFPILQQLLRKRRNGPTSPSSSVANAARHAAVVVDGLIDAIGYDQARIKLLAAQPVDPILVRLAVRRPQPALEAGQAGGRVRHVLRDAPPSFGPRLGVDPTPCGLGGLGRCDSLRTDLLGERHAIVELKPAQRVAATARRR